MDNWILNFSDYLNSTWVNISIDHFYVIECIILFRVFVPQFATLPTDNSTSEWDHVKYLIDNFASSRSSFIFKFQVHTFSFIRSGRFNIICDFYFKYHWIFSSHNLHGKS